MKLRDNWISEVIPRSTQNVENVHGGKQNKITHDCTCCLPPCMPTPGATDLMYSTHTLTVKGKITLLTLSDCLALYTLFFLSFLSSTISSSRCHCVEISISLLPQNQNAASAKLTAQLLLTSWSKCTKSYRRKHTNTNMQTPDNPEHNESRL